MNDTDVQHELHALRTSQRWATLMIVLVIIGGGAALVWAVDHYFGAGGVRVLLVAGGFIAVVVLIYAMSIGVSAIYGRQAMAHHDNVLSGLIAFQRADDYGEVARQVAGGITGVMRSGNTLDSRVLTVANQLAKQQTQMLMDSQRQQLAGPTWAMGDDDEVAGQFKQID